MQEFKFCPMCAAALIWDHVDGKDRLRCSSCEWIHYQNPVPVVACLVLNKDNKLLFIKRGVDPAKGKWALPGGYVEIDETFEEAGKRELYEETGIEGTSGKLVGVYLQESSAYGYVMIAGVEFTTENYDIKIGDDATDAKFMDTGSLPEVPFTSHKKLINNFLGNS